MSIYELKPRFQNMLRPLVSRLNTAGVTANQITIFACLVSVLLGLWLYFARPSAIAFALIPVWMLFRMALNAIDGMLAREFYQKSTLGTFLNELTDVISDAALYLPFALVAPFEPFWIAVVVTLAGLSEFAGALGLTVGASRRYDGPFGKSDRAFVFGALALWVAIAWPLPDWTKWLMPLLAVLTLLTIVNRVRGAIREVETAPDQQPHDIR